MRVEVGHGGSATPSFFVAIILGVTTKALLHIRLFNISSAGSEFPVGVETFVHLYEPWLLDRIDLDEFNQVAAFLKRRAGRYKDLEDVKGRIKENLPGTATLPENRRTAFEVDLDRAASVRAAMEIYLRAFGVPTLDRVFPEKGRR